MGCEISGEKREYSKPSVDFDTWSQEKLTLVKDLINEKIESIQKPKLIVFEMGHFTLPRVEDNIKWAKQNVDFVDKLAGKIIKRYKSDIRLMATLLINNLDGAEHCEADKVLEEIFGDKKYLPLKNIKILSERNLKNRAYKALKRNSTLADSFIQIDGKAYLKDEEYQHDLAAGFVDDDGNIIPRCGLILTSFLDKVAELAKARMYPELDYEVIFVSFSQEFHEYQRVKLGVDIYSSTHTNMTITPIISHWGYDIDQCYTSHRDSNSKVWKDLE